MVDLRSKTNTLIFLILSKIAKKIGASVHRHPQSNIENVLGEDVIARAAGYDYMARFREIVSDPLNILIERHPLAGMIDGNKVTLHNGISVPAFGDGAYYGDFSDILIINRGVHEPLEEFCFQQLLGKLDGTPTMLELGAYWGHYSLWFRSKFKHGNSYLVEPAAENLKIGQKNFSDNGYSGTFINDLVREEGFVVDKFMDENNLETLHILHSDIQGAEVEMLDGAKNSLLSNKIQYCFVSTHSEIIHEECFKKLRDAGYRIEVSANYNEETTSSDGIIVASSTKVSSLFDNFDPMGRQRICMSSSQEIIEYLQACNA